jgi:formylglycine-generating enzyme required for sulfatase activity
MVYVKMQPRKTSMRSLLLKLNGLVCSSAMALALSSGRASGQNVPKSVTVVARQASTGGRTMYTDSFALFVGVGKYQNAQIPGIASASNDARTIRDLLVSKFGFNPDPSHTILLLDEQATKQNIEREVTRLCDHNRIKSTDRVFVFFSCHGQGVPSPDGPSTGYLIPYDAAIKLTDAQNPADFQDSCIEMSEVVRRLGQCQANHRVIVLDACFSGLAVSQSLPAPPRFNSSTVQELLAERGLFVLTAGSAQEEVAGSSDPTQLSLFTKAFRDTLVGIALDGQVATFDEVAANASARTLAQSDGRQKPIPLPKSGAGSMLLFPTEGNLPIPQGPASTGVTAAASGNSPQSSGANLATTATLAVTVSPSDATIEVDGKATSAISMVEMEPGGSKTVFVRASKPYYKPQGYSVGLIAGQTTPLNIVLKPLQTVAGSAVIPANSSVGRSSIPRNLVNYNLSIAGRQLGDEMQCPKDGTEFIWIPPTSFYVGDDDLAPINHNRTRKTFESKGFWMAKNCVTWGQYKKFCAETGHALPPPPAWGIIDDHPVVNVTRQDCLDYCEWVGAVLPFDYQWELAARGPNGLLFPYGNSFDANKCISSVGSIKRTTTAPIGSIPEGASPYGCLDMSGNVWQRVQMMNRADSWERQGGSFSMDEEYRLRCSYHWSVNPMHRYPDIGFRISSAYLN